MTTGATACVFAFYAFLTALTVGAWMVDRWSR
jgi:hypothetical protein